VQRFNRTPLDESRYVRPHARSQRSPVRTRSYLGKSVPPPSPLPGRVRKRRRRMTRRRL